MAYVALIRGNDVIAGQRPVAQGRVQEVSGSAAGTYLDVRVAAVALDFRLQVVTETAIMVIHLTTTRYCVDSL